MINFTSNYSTADLMVFTNCNVRYYQTSTCIPEIVDKIIRIDGKVVLLILKKPLEIINPEYDIIKFAIGANNNNEDCYIPFIDYFHEYNDFGKYLKLDNYKTVDMYEIIK